MVNAQKWSGVWHNQYGSEVHLNVDENGRVFGKFRTNVGRAETKEIWANYWFDVIGFVNGDLISFVVSYKATGALSSVSGRFVSKEESGLGIPRIETVGHTSFNAPKQDTWRSTVATSAVYEPGPSSVL